MFVAPFLFFIMSRLYTSLSSVYEAMYQTFINYEEEFVFYESIRNQYKAASVLELGCGTGNMAPLFLQAGCIYTGTDISEHMLAIAKQKHKNAVFVKADMRDFELQQKFDFCLAAGRTVSYLVTDEDVWNCFKTVSSHMNENGIFCFDFIDASRFIPLIAQEKEVVHEAFHEQIQYKRSSFWKINAAQSFTFHWHSAFYELKENGEAIFLGDDESTIRAFTKDDIGLFLQCSGFQVLNFINKASYAFDTFVVIAQKTTN
jgi:SAM-dependent methyltransferase